MASADTLALRSTSDFRPPSRGGTRVFEAGGCSSADNRPPCLNYWPHRTQRTQRTTEYSAFFAFFEAIHTPVASSPPRDQGQERPAAAVPPSEGGGRVFEAGRCSFLELSFARSLDNVAAAATPPPFPRFHRAVWPNWNGLQGARPPPPSARPSAPHSFAFTQVTVLCAVLILYGHEEPPSDS